MPQSTHRKVNICKPAFVPLDTNII